MSTTVLALPDFLHDHRRVFGKFWDFDTSATVPEGLTDTSGDTGAACASADGGTGGVETLTTGATDNNECYLHSTLEVFKFAANKAIWAGALVKYTEAATDDANVAFGLCDAVGADTLVDNGAGLKTTASGVAFVKVDGGTVWKAWTSLSTTQTTTDLSAANTLTKSSYTPGGGVWQLLEIHWQPLTSTTGEARFFIDGVHVYSKTFTYTSATDMEVFVGVKAGDTNSEVVSVDYLYCYQQR